jgi:hypothetical protein
VNRYLPYFDEIWIPDTPDRILSGKLTDLQSDNVRFVGHLSDQVYRPQDDTCDIAAILSGPEPQRTKLEQEILPQLKAHPGKCALVRGLIKNNPPTQEGNVHIYPFMDRAAINTVLNSTKMIICRSGYSSLMDLMKVGSKALLIPTPGQPEQVYLGERMTAHPQFCVQRQGKVNIHAAWNELSLKKNAVPEQPSQALLQIALAELDKMIISR